MSDDKIHIVVFGGPEEPPISDPSMQSALHDFSAALRAAGMDTNPRMLFFDDAATPVTWIGEFAGLVKDLSPLVVAVLVAWIGRNNGRKVRLKIGDGEFEANTVEDVERLVELAKKRQSKKKG